MCRRGRCLPSWSVGDSVQLFASGRIMMQLVVYGRLRDCSRSRKIRAPQRRAIGTEKSLCRQGATQGVAPTLLSCPTGFAVCTCPTLAEKDGIGFRHLGPRSPPLPRIFRRFQRSPPPPCLQSVARPPHAFGERRRWNENCLESDGLSFREA
jgi:hypothetical protein